MTIVAAVAGLAVAAGALVVGLGSSASAGTYSLLDGKDPSKARTSRLSGDLELGLRFSVTEAVTLDAVRFLKARGDVPSRTVTLWDDRGQRLSSARTSAETASGWQRVSLPGRTVLQPGRTYVASYHSRKYMYTERFFSQQLSAGPLRAPGRQNGVYAYGSGFPTRSHRATSYWIDPVVSTGAGVGTPASTVTTSPSASASGGAGTGTATSTTAPTSSSGTGGSGSADGAGLALPRVPWEGGSQYWKQFPGTAAGGWTDPGFFPIVVWYDGISNDAEAQYDKKLGINSYIGMDRSTPYSLFADNGLYWIGDKLNSSFTPASKNWVGHFLDDEVDGRFTPAQGQAHLAALKAANDGKRFSYANFTQMVVSQDMKPAEAEAFVNKYTDAVSMDMYFYTIPFCGDRPYRENYLTPVPQATCRTASSYGKFMESLRKRDATDGKLQSLWQFVELVNGGPGGGPFTANVTPAQLRGAVMNSIINEARGIVYFNQSLSGPCQASNIVRQSQVTKNFCGNPQVQAMGTVNNQIKDLAPVLNSQSYVHSFGPGLDTMLKTYRGDAYVFAMTDGTTGTRTFTLPAGVNGSQVEVMFEDRRLAVAGGSFSDGFASENSYHVYRIPLAGKS